MAHRHAGLVPDFPAAFASPDGASQSPHKLQARLARASRAEDRWESSPPQLPTFTGLSLFALCSSPSALCFRGSNLQNHRRDHWATAGSFLDESLQLDPDVFFQQTLVFEHVARGASYRSRDNPLGVLQETVRRVKPAHTPRDDLWRRLQFS